MELLLLLTAFLTALTGAITGVRPAQGVAQEQVVAGERAAVAVVRSLPARPVQGWPVLAAVLHCAERPLAIGLSLPVYGQRRRE